MANIYDVAKRARVSAATVSAVVNDSAYVSPVLRSRVEEAVGELDYRPNSVARSLAQQRTRIIGMVALNIANPFWPVVVRGAEDAVRARGYELMIANSDDDPDKEAQALRMFLAKRVDGILLTKACGRLPADLHEQLKVSRVPVVQLMRLGTGLRSDVVTVDEEGGAYEAVSHLLRLGYTRIGMLNGPNVSTSRRRLAGYKQALQSHRRRRGSRAGGGQRLPGRGRIRERHRPAAAAAGRGVRRQLPDGGGLHAGTAAVSTALPRRHRPRHL